MLVNCSINLPVYLLVSTPFRYEIKVHSDDKKITFSSIISIKETENNVIESIDKFSVLTFIFSATNSRNGFYDELYLPNGSKTKLTMHTENTAYQQLM